MPIILRHTKLIMTKNLLKEYMPNLNPFDVINLLKIRYIFVKKRKKIATVFEKYGGSVMILAC